MINRFKTHIFIIISSLSLTTIWNYANYLRYWKVTIFRVQTVDFNILSHTLPTKISYALIKKETKELQRTLDSNYGLSQLVVTDCKITEVKCPEQKIIYHTKSRRFRNQRINLELLHKSPYDLLRDPPPILTEAKYQTVADSDRQPTGETNSGKIIGRVYYVRSDPPDFIDSIWRWIRNPFSSMGTTPIYSITTLVGLLIGGGVIALLESNFQAYQRITKEIQAELENKQKQINRLIKDQETKVKILEDKIDNLETEKNITQQEKKLKEQELSIITDQLNEAEDEIKTLHNDLELLEKSHQEGLILNKKQAIESKIQEINLLRGQVANLDREKSLIEEYQLKAEEEVSEIQKQLETAQIHINNLQVDLAKSKEKEKQLENQNINQLKEELILTKNELQQYINNFDLENDNLRANIEELEKEKSALISEYNLLEEKYEKLERQLPINSVVLLPNLSNFKITFVGGHQTTRTRMINILCDEYHLGDYNEIGPSSDNKISFKIVKERCHNSDLVVMMTDYIGHDLSRLVDQLKLNKTLLRVQGKSAHLIIKRIIAHLTEQNFLM